MAHSYLQMLSALRPIDVPGVGEVNAAYAPLQKSMDDLEARRQQEEGRSQQQAQFDANLAQRKSEQDNQAKQNWQNIHMQQQRTNAALRSQEKQLQAATDEEIRALAAEYVKQIGLRGSHRNKGEIARLEELGKRYGMDLRKMFWSRNAGDQEDAPPAPLAGPMTPLQAAAPVAAKKPVAPGKVAPTKKAVDPASVGVAPWLYKEMGSRESLPYYPPELEEEEPTK